VRATDPQANKETVLKKINNLHSSFGKERKKVLMAKKSGMSSQDRTALGNTGWKTVTVACNLQVYLRCMGKKSERENC
jgi:hypothetical protein